MAAPAPSRAAAPGGGRRILGLPAYVIYLGAGALILGLAYFYFKRKGASSAASTAAATATGQGCFDSSGNAVPCPSTSVLDYSGQLSTLQTEIQNLAGAQAAENECPAGYTFTPSPGGAATAAAPGPGTPGTSSTPGTTGTTANGTPVTTTTGPGPLPQGAYQVAGGVCVPNAPAGTPPPKPPAGVQRYPAPSNCRVTQKGRQNFVVQWNEVSDPSTGTKAPSYTVEVWQMNGRVVWQHQVTAPVDNIFGLTPGWSYVYKIWANGGKMAPAGCSGTVTGV